MLGDDFGISAEQREQWQEEDTAARRADRIARVVLWGIVALVLAGAFWGLR